jgi:hypothetical protein
VGSLLVTGTEFARPITCTTELGKKMVAGKEGRLKNASHIDLSLIDQERRDLEQPFATVRN